MPERGEKVTTQKDLEYYLAQFRRIAENREKGAMRKIWTEYKELLKDLKHFLADYYAEYAVDDQLTFEILNGKRQYARFLEEVSEHVRHYMPRIAKETISVVDDTYKIAYDGMVDAVEKSVTTEELKENLKGVKASTPSQVRAGVLNDLSGITPEMTYTKDTAQFIYDLQRTLNTGLVNGDRYSTMAKRVAERCDISYRRSQLIVRTETHRVREKGFLDSGIEINQVLEKGSTPQRITKRWKSMHDEKVRHTKRANHREVDGVTVGIDEEFTLLHGVKAMSPGSSGTAYNDCNCRCILVYELKGITGKATQKPIDKTAESGIIEATTIEEAETQALKYAETVNYNGAKNIENINQVNKTLDSLTNKYSIKKYENVTVKSLRSGTIARANAESLDIGKQFVNIKEVPDDARRWKENLAVAKKNIQLYQDLLGNTEKIKRYSTYQLNKLKKELRYNEETLKYSRWHVGETETDVNRYIKAMISHEYGHTLADQYFGQINGLSVIKDEARKQTSYVMRNKVADVFKEAKKSGDIYKLSMYASTNVQEFFAEAFAAREMGEKLPDYFVTMLEEVLK